ncbi:DUF5069 domain-containing protein [Candidatus Poribacteria bacterium]|jgi:hypothetical protein|nr:DUF5069 domain-containing protein [Candidatus Poribacteria bacterium]MBT5715167.1 DUF5069 domain-containing protein [Candidatus Poribacteria bacterium]MBT7807372.1 DUF5069 domain-containing protein [Candidatus Poribacteria bacterium]
MDLSAQPPRSPYCIAVLGLVGAARAADKARADIAGTLGEYAFGATTGLDSRTLAFLDISRDDFLDAVRESETDAALTVRLRASAGKAIDEIKQYNDSQRYRAADTGEAKASFDARKAAIDRQDIRMVSDMLDAEDVDDFGPPSDLTAGPPRSAYSGSLCGVVLLARIADKGRAALAATAGDYRYGAESGLDRQVLEYLRIPVDEFTALLRDADDEGALAAALMARIDRTDAEIDEYCRAWRAAGPLAHKADDFAARAAEAGRPDIDVFFDLLDAEDVAAFPR